MGNVLFAKSHPEHEYDKILTCLFKKDLALTLDHLMIMMYRFVKKTGNNL